MIDDTKNSHNLNDSNDLYPPIGVYESSHVVRGSVTKYREWYSDTVIVSECTVYLNVRLSEGLFLRNEKFVDDDVYVPTNWKVLFPNGCTLSLLET